jgi:hypothetical protein
MEDPMGTITRVAAGAAVAAGTLLTSAGAAGAHVHLFTPLLCLTTDDANAGAAVGFVQAADAAAPLQGPTAIIPHNASDKLPSGGQGADHACG